MNDHISGGRKKDYRNVYVSKQTGRWWKAGRKPMPFADKGRLTTVRVPPDMWALGVECNGLSALIRVLWSILASDPALLAKVKAESALYYPYDGMKPLEPTKETPE